MKSLFTYFVLFFFVCYNYAQEKRISAEEYIRTYESFAIEEMRLYKIPASITLAQGMLESDNGNSTLAKNANNHFGIKCKTEWTGEKYFYDDDEKNECFRKYSSVWESYRDHSLFLSQRPRYQFLFQLPLTDYTGWAKGLKQAGYATEPRYAELLIKIIETYRLYMLDSGKLVSPTLSFGDTLASGKHKQTEKVIKEKKILLKDSLRAITADNPEDFQEVILSETRRRTGTINGVRYVKAQFGDTYGIIAGEFGLKAKQIAVYNDSKKNRLLARDEIVYIEPKKEAASIPYHTVTAGETLHQISQKYGIKLSSLCEKNHLKPGSELQPGQKLYLRENAPLY